MNHLKNLDELISVVEEEVKKVKNCDKVCVIHHDDADGCCSAAILSILLFKLTNQFPVLFPIRGPNNISKNLLSKLKIINPDHLFTLDVTIDPKKLSIFNGFILDHHMQNIPSRENMLYINPRVFEEVDEMVPPTSYMVYKLLKRLFHEERVSWIAAIGITEDHRVDACKEVFFQVAEEYPEFFRAEKIDQESVEKSVFGELWDMVRSGRMVKRVDGVKIAVQALIECKNDPMKFINGGSTNSYLLRKFYEVTKKEMDKVLQEVLIKGKFYDEKKVLVYEAGFSKINSLTSFVSDKLRQMYPEWIVCVVGREFKGQNRKISIRLEQSRREANLVEIVNKIKEIMPEVKGGGHKSAVGVTLPKDSVNRFFKVFLSLV